MNKNGTFESLLYVSFVLNKKIASYLPIIYHNFVRCFIGSPKYMFKCDEYFLAFFKYYHKCSSEVPCDLFIDKVTKSVMLQNSTF